MITQTSILNTISNSQRKRLQHMGLTLRIEATEGIYGPTVQGEGLNIGMPVTFVRFYGCDFHCTWCDTPYAVPLLNNGTGRYDELTIDEIIAEIKKIGCYNIVLSGGHPLIFGDKLIPLIETLKQLGKYYIQVETQGSIIPSSHLFEIVDFWSISPKLLSAGEMMFSNWKAVKFFVDEYQRGETALQLKFVVADEKDYEALKYRLEHYPSIYTVPIGLQPEGQQLQEEFSLEAYMRSYENLIVMVNRDKDYWNDFQNLAILPQLHKMVWRKDRGH